LGISLLKDSFCILVVNFYQKIMPTKSTDSDDDNKQSTSKKIFNFASSSAGAIILDKPSNSKGFSHLLDDDYDKYGITSCSEKKWVVIGLSEDILISSVVLSNNEKFSSMYKTFQILASTSFPTDDWLNLGLFDAQPVLGEQIFEISNTSSIPHTRYLKFKFLTHYGNEDLCTLTQIKVIELNLFFLKKVFYFPTYTFRFMVPQ
jgi:hypothetical protein